MKKINKTEEYEKLRKVAEEAGMNQYDAAAAAMEMVLNIGKPSVERQQFEEAQARG